MILKPNPEFLKVDPAARKKWHDALLSTEHPQGRTQMVSPSTDGTPDAWCCLMVGHDAFGGTDEQRNEMTPEEGPFVRLMGGIVPRIALDHGIPIKAFHCNDSCGLTFAEIARLVYPEAYGETP